MYGVSEYGFERIPTLVAKSNPRDAQSLISTSLQRGDLVNQNNCSRFNGFKEKTCETVILSTASHKITSLKPGANKILTLNRSDLKSFQLPIPPPPARDRKLACRQSRRV